MQKLLLERKSDKIPKNSAETIIEQKTKQELEIKMYETLQIVIATEGPKMTIQSFK